MDRAPGRICTFYSFKGGVGRTMSLANVAFLSAAQGQRVLVMDWDLEAPGLWYYFRGLIELDSYDDFRDAPGTLNILWDWRRQVRAVESEEEAGGLLKRFGDGTPFSDCVRNIFRLADPGAGRLDYINAGSEQIQTDADESISYADALSTFPWSRFHEGMLGNSLIELWRRWAKANYDLVLIDSRTGFADVAGLCTMGFPDEVVLCMILNRQNIDGTARVAAEIRRVRGNEVTVRVAPMRTGRDGSSEQDNAIAKARSALVKVGGLVEGQIARDFEHLHIPAADGVPFYETLAPFAAATSTFDLLTLAYCRMASSLFERDIKAPAISDEFRERVRRRQDPRTATMEYLSKLGTLEPARALAELDDLIDSAVASTSDGAAPSYEYVEALVTAAYGIDRSTADAGAYDVFMHLIDLLRRLHQDDPSAWRHLYIRSLYRELSGGRHEIVEGSFESLALFDELDTLLASDDRLPAMQARLHYKRRSAWLRVTTSAEGDAGIQAAIEALQLALQLQGAADPGSDEYLDGQAGEAEMGLLLGDAAVRAGRPQDGMSWYQAVCDAGRHDGASEQGPFRQERSQYVVQAHMRLAFLNPSLLSRPQAAAHALQAIEINPLISLPMRRLSDLSRLFADEEVPLDDVERFVDHVAEVGDRASRTAQIGLAKIGVAMLANMIDSFGLIHTRLVENGQLSDSLSSLRTVTIQFLDGLLSRSRRVAESLDVGLEEAVERLAASDERATGSHSPLRSAMARLRHAVALSHAPTSHLPDA